MSHSTGTVRLFRLGMGAAGALLVALAAGPRVASANGGPGERHAMQSSGADAYVLSVGGHTTSTNLSIEDYARIREKRSGDFLWFRRAGKGFVIEDGATLAAAAALFGPLRALEPEQEDLRLRERALEEKERALDRAEEDIDREMDRLSEGTDLEGDDAGGDEMESEADAREPEADAEDVRARMDELRDRQGELRDHQREVESGSRELEAIERDLDSREDALEREAESGLWKLMDDAVGKGIAKPSARP